MKTETCELTLNSFEYFCQISSKSILIILSYTVSNLVHFERHSVESVSRFVLTSALPSSLATMHARQPQCRGI